MSSAYTIYDGKATDVVSSRQYEVFLSFRGPDTRDGFTDHLYTRLLDAGIRTYRDDEELRVGEEIGPELIAGINQSRIAIPIFSKRYAASKWCLKELVHIVECKKSRGLKVMPIFYNVTPFEVRNQTGGFADAFVSHEKFYDDQTIKVWKTALKEVGNLKGWDIQCDTNRQEGKLVKEVTNKILRDLKKAYLIVTDCLVGVDHHVKEILNKIRAKVDGVRILGIYGMGGIGKTTLAKVIYNRLLGQFESSTFLADVRETSRSKGMEFLQGQLVSNLLNVGFPVFTNTDEGIVVISTRLSNKKVLILLDDVHENFQLQGLVGKRNWFGSGTRIIVTTRNKRVLDYIQVEWPFELNSISPPQALELFSNHAFRDNKPPQEHVKLSKKIVEKTGGLPLTVEVVGSLLYGLSIKYWDSILNKLEKVPQKEVIENLRISFEALDGYQRHIFLDIACFFIGVDQRMAIYFWDDSELFAEEAIEALQKLSLIKVQEDNLLWMHDQLRNYGRHVVCQENIMEPEKRSRLWNLEEATKIYMTKKETENIQGIYVELNEKSLPYFIEEELSKLSKLRLFWVERNSNFSYHNWPLISAVPSNFLAMKPHIFSEVRWLSWPDFPHMYVETSNFSLLNLTILNLSNSSFTIDWDGWSQIKMAKKLKVLDLHGCQHLVKTPNFSSHLLLERLILQDCWCLDEIDESIGMLEHLVHLNLSGCQRLHKLPKELYCMRSLTELLIDKTGIVEIPWWCSMVFSAFDRRSLNCISLNNLTSLKKLSLANSPITSISDSIGELVNLSELDLHGCELLKKLPESMGGLVSLIQLDIWNSGIEELPNSIGCLKNLRLLRMSSTPIRELPITIEMARKLEEIDASYCEYLLGLPKLPESLINLTLSCTTMAMIPDLSNLTNLRQLQVAIHKWDLWHRGSIELASVQSPRSLWSRELASIQSSSPWWIGKLSKLEKLELVSPTITTLHPDLGGLSQLKELVLRKCNRLQTVPKLPSNLTTLMISSCESLETIPDLSYQKKLSVSGISDTPLVKFESLHSLEILSISDCHSLVKIQGRLESLKTLWIVDCESLVKIPDVLNVGTLEVLHIASCPKLCHERTLLHNGPILTNNPLMSKSEQSFMNTMLKICGYPQLASCLGKRKMEGEGKEIEKMD